MLMPLPDPEIIKNKKSIIKDLKKILNNPENVIYNKESLKAYETDGLTAYKNTPLVVVLPENTSEVAEINKFCMKNNIKIVPRGAGTGLSGGALPLQDGIVVGLSKFNRILEIDYNNRCVVTQPGVTNLAITNAVKSKGFHYAPDPSSQIACSVGGNVAENSGGVHCLKYGVTTNNLLGLEIVTIDGKILRLGGKYLDSEGYDLLGVLTGSEGLLGIITEVTVKIIPTPQSARALLIGFDDIEEAALCVSEIIEGGIIPSGVEMMDKFAIEAAEQFCNAGYPKVDALLIVELDGPKIEVDYLVKVVEKIATKRNACSIRASKDDGERLKFWAGRKAAFPAIGRISPDYMCMDGTIPRNKLPEVLVKIKELSKKHGLRVANVFHAGDGNLHPLILYDANISGELESAEAFGADILKLCVSVGGVLSGEHGIGVEKRDLMDFMFDQNDIEHQQHLKCAFDPNGLLNPGKMFPKLHRCAELGKMHVHKGITKFPDLPRF